MIDLKAIVRDFYNRAFDRWLGIETMEPIRHLSGTGSMSRDHAKYVPTDYIQMWAYLRWARLQPDDVYVDIGCGAGRSLCLAARSSIRKCIGIEYNASLAAVAKVNAGRLRGRRAEVEVRIADAAQADYAEGTVFYLYNPFGERTLAAVIDAIGASLAAAPREIRIIYAFPMHDERLAECRWLERYLSKRVLFANATASFWKNTQRVRCD